MSMDTPSSGEDAPDLATYTGDGSHLTAEQIDYLRIYRTKTHSSGPETVDEAYPEQYPVVEDAPQQ